jgi:arabinan endo-1,5-alpha-L-arabinosidase
VALSRRRPLLALVLATALTGTASTGATAAPPTPATPPAPTFADVSVHDPSVVASGDDLWVFGSHLAAAKTKDLMSWKQTANLVSADNPLFDDVRAELKETFDWAQTDTLWAADVIQLGDGRFYMYYNACKGDSPRSAMGLAVADRVEGPYEDLGIFLRSGMWGAESDAVDGAIYDARVHPNVVDPDTFVDADGKLWMVYGSYSGGIFILELDPESGKPLPGQGYGKHLMGGNHSRIEAPNIMFDEKTGYYYLFTSFGGLDATGAYNMRVARSTNPDGPYVDAEGNDMSLVKSDPSRPLFDDASIEPFGVKVMGNFLFDREVGDPGSGLGVGYVSAGHNTTYVDPETGEQFLVFHTRFPGQGEQHQVRVHQMFMNAEGWPVVAPYRYAGGTAEKVRRADLVGEYAFVDHGKAITADVVEDTSVRLNQDGTVTGAVQGTWERQGHNGAALRVDGSEYSGVFTRQWEPTSATWVMTFTVQSAAGVSLWGSKVAPLTAQEAVDAVLADLTLGDTSGVIADLTLPTDGTHGASISWASSAPEVVSPTGDVQRPVAGAGDATVTLTATVRAGDVEATTSFTVTVKQRAAGGLVGTYSFDGTLAAGAGALPDGTVTGDRINNTGGTVTYTPGVRGDAVRLDGSSGVRLPNGLLSGPTYTVGLWLKPEALTQFTTAFFGARDQRLDPTDWVSVVPFGHGGVGGSTMVWSAGARWFDGGTGSQIPVGKWSHVALTVDGGDARIYVDGVLEHEGTGFNDVFTTTTGAFAVGVNYWDIPFKGAVDELSVYTSALTPTEVAVLAGR